MKLFPNCVLVVCSKRPEKNKTAARDHFGDHRSGAVDTSDTPLLEIFMIWTMRQLHFIGPEGYYADEMSLAFTKWIPQNK